MKFGTALTDQMKIKNWDIAKLAKETYTSYEYGRRLTTGQSFPSRNMCTRICKLLGLNKEEMWGLVISDKITAKYGAVPGHDARFTELEQHLPYITEEQFQTVLGMVEGWAGRNRKNAVEAKVIGKDAVTAMFEGDVVEAMFPKSKPKKVKAPR